MGGLRELLNKAKLFLQEGDLVKAGEHFKEAIELDPVCIEAHKGLGRCYYKGLVNVEKAFTKGLKRGVVHLSLDWIEKIEPIRENAKSSLEKAVELGDNDEKLFLELADLYWTHFNKASQAEKYWSKALSIDPNSAEAHFCLGRLFSLRKKWKEAVKHLSKAIQLNDKNPEYFFELGQALYKKGNRAESVRYYEAAVNLNPVYKDAVFNLGTVFFDLGKRKKALEVWRKFIELEPVSDDTYRLKTQFPELID